MIQELRFEQAQTLFESLSPDQKLATLSPRFVIADAQREHGSMPQFPSYTEGSSFWLHGVHRRPIPGGTFFDLQSPYGYGGPLANNEDPGFISRAWKAYSRWCTVTSVLAEFVRFHPMAENWRYYRGQVDENRQTVAVPIGGSDLLASYQTRCRRHVRKAIAAGIEVVRLPAGEYAVRFGQLYRDGMESIGADASYLFCDAYFQAMGNLPDSELLIAQRDGQWLAGVLLLHSEATMEYHLGATSADGRGLGALNLLLHHAALLAQQRGGRWLFLGGGTDSSPDNPLLFFKSGFSDRRFPFFVGHAVHAPEEYQRLKADHLARGGVSNRVLFYR